MDMDMSDVYHSKLCSMNSATKASILLINEAQLPVKVFWIGYKSELVLYAEIAPGQKLPMNTFATHPWIFKDFTGELMRVKNCEVFWPKSSTSTSARTIVQIHSPLRSLKRSALIRVIQVIQAESRIDELSLPTTLMTELKFLYQKYIEKWWENKMFFFFLTEFHWKPSSYLLLFILLIGMFQLMNLKYFLIDSLKITVVEVTSKN